MRWKNNRRRWNSPFGRRTPGCIWRNSSRFVYVAFPLLFSFTRCRSLKKSTFFAQKYFSPFLLINDPVLVSEAQRKKLIHFKCFANNAIAKEIFMKIFSSFSKMRLFWCFNYFVQLRILTFPRNSRLKFKFLSFN